MEEKETQETQEELYSCLEDSIEEKIKEFDLSELSKKIKEFDLSELSKDDTKKKKQIENCYNNMIKIYEYNIQYIINKINRNIHILADKILKSAKCGNNQFRFDIDIKNLDIVFDHAFIKMDNTLNMVMNLIYRSREYIMFGDFIYNWLYCRVYDKNITDYNNLQSILNKFLKEYLKKTNYKFVLISLYNQYQLITFNLISGLKIVKDNGETQYIDVGNLFCQLLPFDSKFIEDINNLFKKIPDKNEPGKYICIHNIKNIEFSTNEKFYPNKLLITIKW